MRTELIANMVIAGVFKDLKEKLKKQPTTHIRDKLMRSIKDCEKYHNTIRTSPPPDVCSMLAELRDYGREMGWNKSGNLEILMGKFKTQGVLEYFVSGRKEFFKSVEGLEEKFKSSGGQLDVSDILEAMPLMDAGVQKVLKKANGMPEDGKLQRSEELDTKQIGVYMMELAKEQGFPLADKKGFLSGEKPLGDKTNKK